MNCTFAWLFCVVIMLPLGAVGQGAESRSVSNLEVLDLDGHPATLPYWGEKTLLIFYMDPFKVGPNRDFLNELNDQRHTLSDEVCSIGIMNLDQMAVIPARMARMMARRQTRKQGALVFVDESSVLPTLWGLGDGPNDFALLLISRQGAILYEHKGTMDKAHQASFYRAIERFRNSNPAT